MQARPGDCCERLLYLVLVEEDVQLLHTDAQVSLIELVRNVPTQWPKIPPFLHQCVEEAEAIQQCLELSLKTKCKTINNS